MQECGAAPIVAKSFTIRPIYKTPIFESFVSYSFVRNAQYFFEGYIIVYSLQKREFFFVLNTHIYIYVFFLNIICIYSSLCNTHIVRDIRLVCENCVIFLWI